jgi:uncharacterized protein DUF6644
MYGESFFEWLVTSPWANVVNGPEWAFPLIQSLHFMGFALSIGTIAIVDLRLLGLGIRRHTASELAADLRRWTLAGFAVMLITGPLMFSADAVNYHGNPSFRFKMNCLAVALLFHFTVHRKATGPQASPWIAKLAGAVSLVLWTAVIAGGRMIAFV